MEINQQPVAMMARKIETTVNTGNEKINSSIKVRNTSLYFEPPVLFVHPADEEITPEVVEKFMKLHKGEKPRYNYLYDLYKGKHEILSAKEKDEYKPDIRLAVNFTKYLVDSFNGYFVGIPPRITHPDENINKEVAKFNKKNDIGDVISELSKMSSIFGRAYAVVYQNEETETCLTYNSPLDMFVVYDDSVEQNPLFACKYNELEGDDGELFTVDQYFKLHRNEKGDLVMTEDAAQAFYDNQLSIKEFYSNEERTSLFEPIITLNNAFNKALSEKGNDIDYFSDAYLAVLGAELEQEGIEKIRENRIINMSGRRTGENKLEVKFLEKPSADQTQEHYLDRLERYIYTIAMAANIDDEKFGSATSGVALTYKLLKSSNLALTVERKFKKSLKEVYKMFFSVPLNFENWNEEIADQWFDLEYTFTRNEPKNLKEEAEIVQLLDGHVSNSTKLSVLSVVEDGKAELDKMADEVASRPGGYDWLENQVEETDEEVEV